MKVTDIAVHLGDIDQPYKKLGEITTYAKLGLFSKPPNIEDANLILIEEAIKLSANTLINVSYRRCFGGVIMVKGTAVFAESDEVPCPFCLERVKRQAKKCKHCGSNLTA